MSASAPGEVLLLACYELGHPPLSLAWPRAFLNQAGVPSRTLDLAVEDFDEEMVRAARFVAVAVPMHTALRLGVEAARRVRALNPRAHLAFHGLYAWLNAEFLLQGPADSVLAGESEQALARLAVAVLRGEAAEGLPGVSTSSRRAAPLKERLAFPVPDRSSLPPLARYAGYVPRGGRPVAAGYVEASRGCKHVCRHCPVVPIYQGRFLAVPVDVVLADVAQQVQAGAQHVTYGDPDFLNGPTHALRVARAVHDAHPQLSFDFTAKVEHLLQHRALLPELRALGCTFVVSAVESLSDAVLARLQKGHTAAQVEEAIAVLDEAGLALHPTLVAFTPWTTLDDYLGTLEFLIAQGLAPHVPPVQLAIRLLVPPGSALATEPDAAEWLGPLEAAAFEHRWTHPDPRMDALQAAVSARVEADEAAQVPALQTWAAVRALAWEAAGRPRPDQPLPPSPRPGPPRLTEHWFC